VAISGDMVLEGGAEMQRALLRLEDRLQRKVLTTAVRKAARPIVRSARGKVPRDRDLLRRSLGTRIKRYRQSGNHVAIIGPRTGFAQTDEQGRRRDPAKYGHIVEGGAEPHFQVAAKIGPIVIRAFRHPGTRPQRFMEPAFDENKTTALNIMGDEVRKGITKAGGFV